MLKKPNVLLIILFALAIVGCTSRKNDGFAIYLLSKDMSALDASKMDLDQLPLRKEPLISDKDIISYDRTNHSIQLTPTAYRRFQQAFPSPVKVSGIPFVVSVGSQRVYSGALWTPASSISYNGVVILQSFEDHGTTIYLTLGYPISNVFTGSDPRSNPRIVGALEQADKLKSVAE